MKAEAWDYAVNRRRGIPMTPRTIADATPEEVKRRKAERIAELKAMIGQRKADIAEYEAEIAEWRSV